MNKKSIVFVSHAFPPLSGGGVQRISKFALYLQKMGYEVEVIASKPGETDWVDEERLEDVASIPVTRLGVRKLSQSLYHKIVRRIWPIDFQFPWAVKAAYHLYKNGYWQDANQKVFVTSGPPHSMHLVGYFAKRLGKQYWVADFRDHFTLGPEYKVFSAVRRRIDKWFEQEVFNYADKVIFNTKLNKDDVEQSSFQIKEDIGCVIYNGYDLDDLIEQGTPIPWPGNKKYNYLYLGGLRGDHVDGIFYQALSFFLNTHPELRQEVSVQIIGNLVKKGTMVDDLGLSDVVFFHEAVAFNNVRDYLEAADGCLTWQRNRPAYRGTIAGKVFDYIGAQKPIFSIGIPNGEIDIILKTYQIGENVSPSNTQIIAEKFQMFHEGVKKEKYTYSETTIHQLHKFDRKHQAKQLSEIISLFTIQIT